MPRLVTRRMADAPREDFYGLHCDANDLGWCRCVAWHVETWEGWGERTADENRALRDRLFDAGEADGYLLYSGKTPVAWCQVGPRDRLAKLCRQYALAPDPDAWAITCFAVPPARRRKGHARRLLADVLKDLARRGVARVEAYPKAEKDGARPEDGDVWTGPLALYLGAGFERVRETASIVVVSKRLPPSHPSPPRSGGEGKG